MSRFARVTAVPIDTGVSLDMYVPTLFGVAGDAPFGLEITDKQTYRELTAVYRHPYSKKAAANLFKSATKNCLDVTPTEQK